MTWAKPEIETAVKNVNAYIKVLHDVSYYPVLEWASRISKCKDGRCISLVNLYPDEVERFYAAREMIIEQNKFIEKYPQLRALVDGVVLDRETAAPLVPYPLVLNPDGTLQTT